MKRIALCALLALLVVADLPAQNQETPDLVVLIAVDQLTQDYLVRYRPQFTGGFKRMLDGGAVFTNGFQDHAVTETAVGHASMLSGRFPRSVGIISNRRGVSDPQTTILGVGTGASPFRFRGGSLIDWMRTEDAASRALSVSIKDRSAILTMGRAKQNVFWWTNSRFTTSTYYGDSLPTWVRAFNDLNLPNQYAGRPWTLLLDAAEYPETDSVMIENGGKEITFPHTQLALTVTPWMDEILAQFALAGVDALELGRKHHPDLLSVSFSTTDYIGHGFGPQSREIHDQILRLDRTLGAFIDSLYARFAPGQIAFALTADHGVTPFPQVDAATPQEAAARMVAVAPIVRGVREWLRARGLDTTAVTLESGMLMLDPQLLRFDRALMDSVASKFVRDVRALPGVLRVDWVRDLSKGDTVRDAITRRWHHTVPPDLAIPVVVTLKPKHVWGTPTVAMHGSPHDNDAQVPIIFYGPQFKAGHYPDMARTVDIAPTLARILRIQPTEALDGKPLTQVLK